MAVARVLIRALAEHTDGALETLVECYLDNSLAARTIAVLCERMDEEEFTDDLAAWSQQRGLTVQEDEE